MKRVLAGQNKNSDLFLKTNTTVCKHIMYRHSDHIMVLFSMFGGVGTHILATMGKCGGKGDIF